MQFDYRLPNLPPNVFHDYWSQSLQCCPFDPTPINHDFPENEAIFSLLQVSSSNLLAGYLSAISGSNNQRLVSCFNLNKDDLKHYRLAVDCIQSLAQLIKPQNPGKCVCQLSIILNSLQSQND